MRYPCIPKLGDIGNLYHIHVGLTRALFVLKLHCPYLRVPATTFVITRSKFRSDKRPPKISTWTAFIYPIVIRGSN